MYRAYSVPFCRAVSFDVAFLISTRCESASAVCAEDVPAEQSFSFIAHCYSSLVVVCSRALAEYILSEGKVIVRDNPERFNSV